MPQRHIPFDEATLKQGIRALRKDKWLGGLVRSIEPPVPNARKDPFHALVVAVLNQQISRVAAKAIEERLATLAKRPFRPASLARTGEKRLLAIGVSGTKARCIINLSKHALKHKVNANSYKHLSDDEILESLAGFKGVGTWTGQMVLVFGLGRPDVMPDGDGGIVRAASILFGIEDRTKARDRLVKIAPSWSPHRTLAAWFLWRSLAGD